MANTYTLIASNTLSSNAASVTFSSIPGTYTDLVLRMSIRHSFSGYNYFMTWTYNSDTATNYSETSLHTEGSPATAASSRQSSQTSLGQTVLINAATSTSNTFTNFEIYLPSYTASQNKPLSIANMMEGNSTDADNVRTQVAAGLWRNTAALTSMTLTATGGNFVSGSSFFLYGIKNS